MGIDEFISEAGPIRNVDIGQGNATVYLKGDIDLNSSPEVRSAMKELIQSKPQELTIDLNEVGYMDSSGVATLVEVLQQTKRYGGHLKLRGLQPRVRSVFEIARLTDIFDISE